MEYYIIIALSFATMYSINYGWGIVSTVLDTLYILDIEYSDYNWNPILYMIIIFITTSVLMPIFIPLIFKQKYKVIKEGASYILINRFGLNDEEF